LTQAFRINLHGRFAITQQKLFGFHSELPYGYLKASKGIQISASVKRICRLICGSLWRDTLCWFDLRAGQDRGIFGGGAILSEGKSDWTDAMSVGVVVRQTPGVTRWAKTHLRPVAVLPGAGPADWKELRRDGEAVEYHAATVSIELHRAEVESYLVCLNMDPPSVFVVLDRDERDISPVGYVVNTVTASAYEAQDFLESGESLVESVPMPDVLAGWVNDFVQQHYAVENFVKRKRDKERTDLVEDGVGDPRIEQEGDVYRAPSSLRKRRLDS